MLADQPNQQIMKLVVGSDTRTVMGLFNAFVLVIEQNLFHQSHLLLIGQPIACACES